MGLSRTTRLNWILDTGVFFSALVAGFSGLYFLYIPVGGYQGGKNPFYDVTVLFSRGTWDDLHLWGGVAMILIVVVHLLYHWDWVVMMTKKIWNQIRSGKSNMSGGAKVNLGVNLAIATSFLLTAISGIYFLFGPTGGYQGGANVNWDIGFLFTRTTWDLIHTWSGIVLIIAAVFHFLIHWKWIKKVTYRFFKLHIRREHPVVRQSA
jgi:hypothetical protein